MAGYEWEGRESRKVETALALDYGKVRATDATENGPEFYPIGAEELGLWNILQTKEAGRAEGEPGKTSGKEASQKIPWDAFIYNQSSHGYLMAVLPCITPKPL